MIQNPLHFGFILSPAERAARRRQNQNPGSYPIEADTLKRLPDEFTPAKRRQLLDQMVLSETDKFTLPKYQLVNVRTDVFDRAFDRTPDQYVGPGGTERAIGNRYQKALQFMRDALKNPHQKIHAPLVVLSEDKDARGKTLPVISFHDGRHRYAVLRDIGMPIIAVGMHQDEIPLAKKYGFLA
ncbi:MAG: hypothetical protein K2X01_02390 [Cyanobacteria bacterium]|nr:hypothetical protein [Cyanobacteriota bacterium]